MTKQQVLRHWQAMSISEHIVWTRRLLPLGIFVTVTVIQSWLDLTLPNHEAFWPHLGIELLVYALLGPAVTWYVLRWIELQLTDKERIERRFREQELRMVQITDDVRAEIASDLHDSLGPNLFAIALKADICKRLLDQDVKQVEHELGVISTALQQSIREVRRAVYALRPIELERLGLFNTLRKLAADYKELNEVNLHLAISGEGERLPADTEAGVFHIVQEALYNVRRHSQAADVWVQVDVTPSVLCLQIRDDGRGFDSQTTAEGVGLRHMRERTQALNGTFSVHTAPGQGTEILSCLPIGKG